MTDANGQSLNTNLDPVIVMRAGTVRGPMHPPTTISRARHHPSHQQHRARRKRTRALRGPCLLTARNLPGMNPLSHANPQQSIPIPRTSFCWCSRGYRCCPSDSGRHRRGNRGGYAGSLVHEHAQEGSFHDSNLPLSGPFPDPVPRFHRPKTYIPCRQ